jgi:hypothetical protein
MFANDAENDQRGGEHCAKGNELAALGFEEIEKVAWFHGWFLGVWSGLTGMTALLVTTTGGGGGESRVTRTLNSFLRESSLRPPSGVPVMAK